MRDRSFEELMQSVYEDSMKRIDEIFKDDIKIETDDNGNDVLTFSGINISLGELHQRTVEEMNEDIRRKINQELEKSKNENALPVSLILAESKDAELIHKMQKEAFAPLLEKYQDFDSNPGTETEEFILSKINDIDSMFYIIVYNGKKVGGIRVKYIRPTNSKKLGPLFILPTFQNKGIAQKSILEIEKLHGSDNWFLDTPATEMGNRHLYEKMGYELTGKSRVINENLTLVHYCK